MIFDRKSKRRKRRKNDFLARLEMEAAAQKDVDERLRMLELKVKNETRRG